MKSRFILLLLLIWVGTSTTGVLFAQSGQVTCIVTLEGQNRNRTVAGAVNEECDDVNYITQWHDPPWGNWGVSSNYGKVTNGDQFLGWKQKGSQKQWNSCTTERAKFSAPNCEYYRRPGCATQWSNDIVTHGRISYRISSVPCQNPTFPPIPIPDFGCSRVRGSFSQTINHMTLYELDKPDRDDKIETLYFPGTSVTLTHCTHDGCPEQTTDWVTMTRSTSSTAHVEAELRMKASARVEGFCDWNW